jgi:hypothetical protein
LAGSWERGWGARMLDGGGGHAGAGAAGAHERESPPQSPEANIAPACSFLLNSGLEFRRLSGGNCNRLDHHMVKTAKNLSKWCFVQHNEMNLVESAISSKIREYRWFRLSWAC